MPFNLHVFQALTKVDGHQGHARFLKWDRFCSVQLQSMRFCRASLQAVEQEIGSPARFAAKLLALFCFQLIHRRRLFLLLVLQLI